MQPVTNIARKGLGNQGRYLPAADRYFDQAQVWLAEPLIDAQVMELCQLNRSPSPNRGTMHVRNKPMKYQPRWKQRIQIRQARPETLKVLADMIVDSPSLVNYAELASDHGYSGDYNVNDRDDAFDLLNECWIRKYHRRSQGVRHVVDEEGNVTRYDGPRRSSNVTVMYQEGHCRNTGEEHSLHLEWRVSSSSACERVKLFTVHDAVKFDHDAFWEAKLAHVYRLDHARLGRRLRNIAHGSRSRAGRYVSYRPNMRFNSDARLGQMLMSNLGSIQALIDEYGGSVVRPALQRIEVHVDGLGV